MALASKDSRSVSRVIRAEDDAGAVRDVCHINGSISDGHAVSINVTVLHRELAAAHYAAAQEQVMRFVDAVLADAASTGVPVRALGQTE